jgi:hypothetical protein
MVKLQKGNNSYGGDRMSEISGHYNNYLENSEVYKKLKSNLKSVWSLQNSVKNIEEHLSGVFSDDYDGIKNALNDINYLLEKIGMASSSLIDDFNARAANFDTVYLKYLKDKNSEVDYLHPKTLTIPLCASWDGDEQVEFAPPYEYYNYIEGYKPTGRYSQTIVRIDDVTISPENDLYVSFTPVVYFEFRHESSNETKWLSIYLERMTQKIYF